MRETLTADAHTITVYVAGDFDEARATCRRYCYPGGLCVTVERTSFLYAGGEEAGVRVGLLNYPRYPVTRERLLEQALDLAERLRVDLCQDSWLVQDSAGEAHWYSARASRESSHGEEADAPRDAVDRAVEVYKTHGGDMMESLGAAVSHVTGRSPPTDLMAECVLRLKESIRRRPPTDSLREVIDFAVKRMRE